MYGAGYGSVFDSGHFWCFAGSLLSFAELGSSHVSQFLLLGVKMSRMIIFDIILASRVMFFLYFVPILNSGRNVNFLNSRQERMEDFQSWSLCKLQTALYGILCWVPKTITSTTALSPFQMFVQCC